MPKHSDDFSKECRKAVNALCRGLRDFAGTTTKPGRATRTRAEQLGWETAGCLFFFSTIADTDSSTFHARSRSSLTPRQLTALQQLEAIDLSLKTIGKTTCDATLAQQLACIHRSVEWLEREVYLVLGSPESSEALKWFAGICQHNEDLAKEFEATTGRRMPDLHDAIGWMALAAEYDCPPEWHDPNQIYARCLGKARQARTPADNSSYYPAQHYRKNNISPDTLRQAAHNGRIRSRKGNGNRNEYCDADVRKCWPHLLQS